MANAYHHGKRVSVSHGILLAAYERAHGYLWVNQGRRTIAEQWHFWNIYRRYGRPVAAYPSPGAPHIKYNREHHALDISQPTGSRVAAFYRQHGVPVSFNVRSESWHMDVLDERALIRAAQKLKQGSDPVIRPGATGAKVLRLKKLMWAHGLRKFRRGTPVYGPEAVRAVKRLQRAHKLRADGIVGPKTWALLK